ncbi:MAG TPA: hypothetical protein VK254_01510 [Candidatus Bathyarchaeia archaeon]|nr:hypothetical protein [Candidatus Bathyarchaeia archaeon]
MDTKKLFTNGKKISSKSFRQNFRQSKATQDFLSNKKIAHILNSRSEKVEFNQIMYNKAKDGLSRGEMQATIGEMKTLTDAERFRLAKEVFPSLSSGQRFIKPKNSSQSKIADTEKAIGQPSSGSKKSASPNQYVPGSSFDCSFAKPGFINRTTSEKTSPPPDRSLNATAGIHPTVRRRTMEARKEKETNPKEGFSGAMAATMKNKRS